MSFEDNLRNEQIADAYEAALVAFGQGEIAQRPCWQVFVPEERERALVERLLELDARYAVQPPQAPSDVLPPAPPDFPSGYEKVEEIGRGGMGIVYKARQLAADGRLVAVKLMQMTPGTEGDDMRTRFLAEIKAVSRLKHPNIVPIYEVGVSAGQPFFSMELIDGKNLKDFAGGKRMEPERAAELIETVARAVQHAHERGVLHRDLKPSNILISQDGTPHLADFGLAKLEGVRAITRTNEMLGTPHYMAPEQANVNLEVTTRADIYSLGVILYELLTGRPPFQGDGLFAVLEQVMHSEPVPPRRLRRDVARDLETICLKCLEKGPRRRYASASGVAEDLRRFLAGEPIVARPVSTTERLVKWARRKPGLAILGVTVLAACAVVIVLSVTLLVLTERRAQDQAEHQLKLDQKDGELQTQEEQLQAKEEQNQQEDYYRRIALVAWALDIGDAGRARQLLEGCPVRRRDYEWHHLDRRCRVLRTYTVPTRFILRTVTALSPDGRRLAVTGDGGVGLLDAETGKVVFTLPQAKGCFELVFSSDGSRLATPERESVAPGAPEPVVRVWDVSTGKETMAPAGRWRPVLPIGPSGLRVVEQTENGAEVVKDWGKRKALFVLPKGAVPKALSQDGRSVEVTVHHLEAAAKGKTRRPWDVTVAVWDVVTGRECLRFRGALETSAFSPDGGLFAVADHHQPDWGEPYQEVKLGDVKQGRMLEPIRVKAFTISVMSFSPDNKRLVLGGSRAQRPFIKVFDVGSGRELYEHEFPSLDPRAGLLHAAFFPDSKRILSVHRGISHVWDVTPEREVRSVRHDRPKVDASQIEALSPDGRHRASPRDGNTVEVRDARTGQALLTLRGHTSKVTRVAYSPDGGSLATASLDKTVRVWDARTGREVRRLGAGPVQFFAVAYSWDGRWLAAGGRNAQGGVVGGAVTVWDVGTWQPRWGMTPQLQGQAIHALTFSPNGKRLVTASAGGENLVELAAGSQVKVWDATTGKELLTFGGPQQGRIYQGLIVRLAFSPDGRSLTATHHDGMVTLWGPTAVAPVAPASRAAQEHFHRILEGLPLESPPWHPPSLMEVLLGQARN
jgi:WD40 repeat protein/predicted Ser/Thr protein kinase